MKSKFIWCFPLRSMRETNSFPYQWAVSLSVIHVPLRALLESDIWLVAAENKRRFLFGHVRVKRLAKIVDDIHDDILTLYADRRTSFAVPASRREKTEWEITGINMPMGIEHARKSIRENLAALIADNYKYTLSSSRIALPAKQIPDMQGKPPAIIAADIYQSVLSFRRLGDIKKLRHSGEPTVFGDIAIASVPSRHSREKAIKKSIRRLDEKVASILKGEDTTQEEQEEKRQSRRELSSRFVDTDLTQIAPDKIVARIFLSPANFRARVEIPQKTQKAEIRHQEILRKMAGVIVALNLKPLQSGSVDLAVMVGGRLVIFEIKSATADNFREQAKKSLLQVLEYRMAFQAEGYRGVRAATIIEDKGSYLEKEYMRKFARYLNIRVFYYNEDSIARELGDFLGKKK